MDHHHNNCVNLFSLIFLSRGQPQGFNRDSLFSPSDVGRGVTTATLLDNFSRKDNAIQYADNAFLF
jgi:hypothetical protein